MSTGTVQSIDRAAGLLRCFGDGQPHHGVSELARRTGLSVSTTHRLLTALAENDLLRPAGQGRYTLGPLVGRLTHREVRMHLRERALPIMHRLRDDVSETIGLHELLATDERAVVDQAESHQPLHRCYTEIGVPIPLALGAPGKVLLAFLPPDRREAVLARPVPKVTPTTVTDTGQLRRELAEVRRLGRAFSFEERTPGVHTIAAPVWDHTPAVIASVSISAPKARMDKSRMQALVTPVREAAWAISRLLGATDDAVQSVLKELGRES